MNGPDNEPMQEEQPRGPRGLGVRTHNAAAEYSQEQGWGTNMEERTKLEQSGASGGTDYDYGAADFGDSPTNQMNIQPTPQTETFLTGSPSGKGK